MGSYISITYQAYQELEIANFDLEDHCLYNSCHLLMARGCTKAYLTFNRWCKSIDAPLCSFPYNLHHLLMARQCTKAFLMHHCAACMSYVQKKTSHFPLPQIMKATSNQFILQYLFSHETPCTHMSKSKFSVKEQESDEMRHPTRMKHTPSVLTALFRAYSFHFLHFFDYQYDTEAEYITQTHHQRKNSK